MGLTKLEATLWILGFVGHAVLLFILVARGRWRSYPVFTSLAAYQLATSILLCVVFQRGTHHAYFVSYWLCAVGDYGLQIALVLEIAGTVCRRNGMWVRTARKKLWIGAAAGVAIATCLCLMVAPPSTSGFDLWDLRASLFSSLLTCELVLSVSITANRLWLQRRNHVMALGQGLALWASVAVLGDVLKVATGWRHDFVIFDQIRMFVYLADLAFWSFAFWVPEKASAAPFDNMNYTALANSTYAALADPRRQVGEL